MAKEFSFESVKRGAGQVLLLLLSILYLAGSSNLESLHAVIHDHEVEVSHTEVQESDPCHRMIYHNDLEQGCDYDSHLFGSNKCRMCDLACHSEQTIVSEGELPANEFTAEHFTFFKQSLDSYWAVISSSRAPPALV